MIKATRSAIEKVRQFLAEDRVFDSFDVMMHDTETNKMRTMTMWFGGGWNGGINPIYNGYVTHVDGDKIGLDCTCGIICKYSTDREIAAYLILSWGNVTKR